MIVRLLACAASAAALAAFAPAPSAHAMACDGPQMSWVEGRIPVPSDDVDVEREGQGVAQSLSTVPENLRPCTTAALVVLAITGNASSELRLDALGGTRPRCADIGSARRPEETRRAIALSALASVDPSWTVVEERTLAPEDIVTSAPRQRAASDAVYGLLECIDRRLGAVEDRRERAWLRKFRGLAELAHANARTNFFAILFNEPIACEDVRAKVRAAEGQRSFPLSEFAVKAVFVEASARVLAASLEACGGPAMVDAALTSIEQAFERNLFARSVEGWRWVNDFLYVEAVLRLVRGDRDGALAAIRKLEAARAVASGTGIYEGNVHSEAVKALADLEAERDANDPYLDQVFVRRPVPGWTRNSQLRSSPFMANRDAAAALRAVVGLDRPDCTQTCADTFATLDRQLRDALVRRDVRVIAGSYGSKGSAEQGLGGLCRRLGENDEECRFRVDPSGRYHRVSTEPMSDENARALARELEDLKIDYFLSRPQVLAPL